MQRNSRKSQQRVTHLTVLIPCNSKESGDGWATFLLGPGLRPVRHFNDDRAAAAVKALTPEQRKMIGRLQLLKRQASKAGLDTLLDFARGVFPPGNLTKLLVGMPKGRVPSPQAAVLDAVVGGLTASAHPFIAVSTAVSAMMSQARPVLWWKGSLPQRGFMATNEGPFPTIMRDGRDVSHEYRQEMEAYFDRCRALPFVPAIYCPDVQAALYVYIFFARGSAAICPECGGAFVRKRPDQLFCSLTHGAAHRVRRSRAKAKKA